MTNGIDVREYLTAFVAEADEQLQVAITKLLSIESAARRNERDPRAIRDLFRALHTIKGLAAMVGVEAIVGVAHHLESALRVLDRKQTMPTLESIDLMLSAVRTIETAVRQLADDKPITPASTRMITALEALDHDAAALAPAAAHTLTLDPEVASRLAPFELELLATARDGRRALRADFVPSPEKAERGLSISSVRERVSAIAEIVKIVPIAVTASAEAPGALSFAVLMLTQAPDIEIAQALGVDPSAIQRLSKSATAIVEPADVSVETEDDFVESTDKRNIVRVDVVRLDDAMEHLSALLVTRSRFNRAIADLSATGVPVRELTEIMREQNRQLRDLRSAILRVRMIPVQEVLQRVPLILRGLQRESGKQVRLIINVGDAELDKRVAERLFPAIVHLVRNAVDHAIEDSDYRQRVGKSAEGTLRIEASAYSNTQLDLSISDDGRGVDRDAVARRLGQPIDEGDAALLVALCRTGMSTREKATVTSGRGMGMDIVKRIVLDQLGGELSMTTSKGIGTTFTMRIPLSISIVDAFTLACDGQSFVVPVAMVEEILEVDPAKVTYLPTRHDGSRRGLIQRRGQTVPLIDLASALHITSTKATNVRQALVVRRGVTMIAFALDRVTGQQEAVVRPLIDPLVQVTGVAGSTDLGDGKPTLVLDLVSLGGKLLEGADA